MVIPLHCLKNWICASIRHVSQDFELSLYTNSQLKVSYNTQDKSWDIDELIAQCVQEETRQKLERGKDVETVNFVQVGKGKKFNNAGNNSEIWLGNLVQHLAGIVEAGEGREGTDGDKLAGGVGVEEKACTEHLGVDLLQLLDAGAVVD
ncbi:uncharacterized protein [Malus domestica]|uniref:uncharacterized protein n=1 Tax=Malus domestica TaxID=3750 RepID=UPI0010AA2DA2|nr:uncharacterized protein LOC114819462 [Malus domestica]